ncbi:ras-related protein Rab-1C-like [Ylistrum balloti]|uniref:ras-related protein Rab-1C-like n=1 Tax=Ylistrum balloti TaxID=509963 RepID=UPI002905F699|nr:ras-related protein Rab-1C-like [Ylistrum balloti]
MNNNNEAGKPPQPYNTVRFSQGLVIVDLMLIGDVRTGKTSLIRRFVDGTFVDSYHYNGCSFLRRKVWIDRSEVDVRLWETQNDERFSTRPYYERCHGVIVVYDVTNTSSFENIDKVWLKDIELNGFRDVVVVIVGTKCDHVDRQVDYKTAKTFADKLNIPLVETSSLTGYGIDRAVMSTVVVALDKILQKVPSISEIEYVNPRYKDDNGCQLS